MPDPSLSSPSPEGPRLRSSDPIHREGGDTDQLRDDLRRAGSTRSTGVVDAALRLVTSLARVTVLGADGVSVTLERHGRMTTIADSDATVRRMDEHQYATGEGPCLDAAAEGRWLHSESLADEQRWPVFVPRALEEGIASIMSTPLFVSARPVGAINMYSRADRMFGPDEREAAAFFARRAGEILGEASELDEEQGVRISAALTSRELIAMAQGVHMSRLGISSDAAAALLYRAARSKEVTVRAEAIAVLHSTGTDDRGPDGHHG